MLTFEWERSSAPCWRLHAQMHIRPIALMINTDGCFVRSARIGVREQDPKGIKLHFAEAPSRTEPCNWSIIQCGEIVRVVIGCGEIELWPPPSLLALVGDIVR